MAKGKTTKTGTKGGTARGRAPVGPATTGGGATRTTTTVPRRRSGG